MTAPDSRRFSTEPVFRLQGLQSQFANGTVQHAAISAGLDHISELNARVRELEAKVMTLK